MIKKMVTGFLLLSHLHGCASQPEGELIFEGENLRYYSALEQPQICEGSFYVQDAFVASLAEYLNVELTEPVDFIFTEAQEPCSGSCVFNGQIFSKIPIHFHELAHAVSLNSGHEGPDPFQEGFATAFGRPFTDFATSRNINDVLRDWRGDATDYYSMALFCHFLIEEHGIDRLVNFFARTSLDTSLEDYSLVFEEVFAESLDKVIIDFESYPRCNQWENAKEILSCGEPSNEWVEGEWRVDLALDCSSQDVYGPDEVGRMLADRTLTIEEEGMYNFYGLASGDDSRVSTFIRKCGSCFDSEIHLMPIEPVGATSLLLKPGTYHVIFATALENGPTDIIFVAEYAL